MAFRFSKKDSSLDLMDLHALELCEFLDKGGKSLNDSAMALSYRFKKHS
ncbi:MAG: hypothetical protein ABIA76_01990 [Candidatus Diapherotrites archaeon]